MENEKRTDRNSWAELDENRLSDILTASQIKATDTYVTPPQIIWIDNSTIATLGNFSASTGKAKAKKTFNVSAIVAASLAGRQGLNYPAHLPEGLRLFASYVMAHALYLRGEYGRSLGMAENALIMKQGSYPISELFLHLAASMACMSLKDIDAAKTHFGVAWNIARPDGLIELIGEHHGLLQGLIEACLKTQYPDDFARIIEITYRFSYGWRRIHNPDSGEDVADDLTTTEFTMAMLACRGWTNAEIARHMGVSPGTVKNRLSGVYAKLGIGTRAELVAHMLR